MEKTGREIIVHLDDEQAKKLDWFARECDLSAEQFMLMVLNHIQDVDLRQWVVDHKRGWSRDDLYDRKSLMKWQRPWLYEEPTS